MKKWTKEPGTFVRDLYGQTWNQADIESGWSSVSIDAGLATVGIDAGDERARVIVSATASLTPAQARQLARVINDAADRAEDDADDRAEDLALKVTATPITKVIVRHSKRIAEEGSE